ncbi:unnamed protein product, partial [marine sediment metagenome]
VYLPKKDTDKEFEHLFLGDMQKYTYNESDIPLSLSH